MTRWRAAAAGAMLAAASLVGAACQAMPAPGPTGDVAAVAGPWQPRPVQAPPELVRAGEAACRAGPVAERMVPAGHRFQLADVRGGSRMRLLFTRPGKPDHSLCDLRVVGQRLEVVGGGHYIDEPHPLNRAIRLVSAAASVRRGAGPGELTMHGSTRAPIVSVRVVLADGTIVTPSVAKGWFVTWWPSGEAVFRIEGRDAQGALIADVDQCGRACP